MEKNREPRSTRRRDFLKLAGLGTAAGAAAAIAGSAAAEEATVTTQSAKAGYRETKHVKTYYAVARF